MASLGVLSVKHREGAIKLLEKSLGFKFEKLEENHLGIKTKAAQAALTGAQAQLANELAEKDARREELIKHILECEEQGYDMSAYKLDVGLITEEEYETAVAEKKREEGERIRLEAVEKDRRMVTQCGTTEIAEDGRPNCNRECHICTHTHCPFRNR